MTRRIRGVPGSLPDGHTVQVNTGEVTKLKGSSWAGTQITESIGHRRNPKTGKYDSGGPFYTSRTSFEASPLMVSLKSDNGAHIYTGPMYTPVGTLISKSGALYKGHRSEDTSDLDPYGATAIAQCAPTNSVAALSTAVGELHKDGLPSLPGVASWRKRTEVAKAAGSEFLNTVFGWLPLVDDVLTVGKAARSYRDVLNQYHRDAGRNVRREFHFPTETSIVQSSSKARAQILDAHFYSKEKGVTIPEGTLTTTVETVVDRWFVGSFTYAVPSSSDSWGRMLGYGSDADHLFGTTLTPDVLWELTPWSWAVDWFSNSGDVIHNVSQFNQYGLVMRYGYMMEHSIKTTTSSLDRAARPGYRDAKVPPSVQIIESKVRRPANPYGFGIGWEDLSPLQLAITAAVGITRL